jgi:hypothetical protein
MRSLFFAFVALGIAAPGQSQDLRFGGVTGAEGHRCEHCQRIACGHDHGDTDRNHEWPDDERWEDSFHDLSRQGMVSFRSSFGFTLGPDTFLVTGEASYRARENWSFGPLFQLGLSDDEFLFGATANFKKTGQIDLHRHHHGDHDDDDRHAEEVLARLEPYVNFGIGVVYIDEDQRGGRDDDDAGLLLNVGFGADFFVSDRFSVGTGVLFNFMPSEVQGENFFFSWQVAVLSFHF